MNDINKNFDLNSNNSSNNEISNSVNISTLIQRLKTNQGTRDSEIDEERIKEKINVYLISKQYNDAIRFIEIKEKIIDDNANNYLFFDIKIKCYYKIINSYLSTYKYKNKIIEYLPSMRVSIVLEKMFSKLIKYFKDIILIINLDNCNESFKEKLIQNYCEGLYLIAKFHKIKSQPQDATAYLSISHSMLKIYIDKCKDPYTFQIYEKILILLISLLIDDNSFYSAMELSIFCLRLCIKELFLRNKSEKGIKIKSLPYIIKHTYIEIFQNITLCLFLMGICYEHLGDLIKAIDSYKQSSWFISKFYFKDNTKLFQIIQGTFIIASKFYEFNIEKMKNKVFEIDKIEKENKKKQKDNKRLKELNKISYGMIYDLEKNPKIAKFLNNEIQINKSGNPITISSHNFNSLSKTEKEKENYPSQATINMIDNIVLYNDLLSEDYQKFIQNIKDINFNNIDKNLLEKLERYNRNLIIDKKKNIVKTQEENINIKKQSSPPHFYKIISSFNDKKITSRYKEHKDFYFKKKKKIDNKSDKSISNSSLTTRVLSATKGKYNIFEKNENRKDKENITQRDKNKLFYKAYFSKKVERYPLSNSYLFNRSYQRKKKILEKKNNREIKFQKDILFLKKIESKILNDIENEDDSTVRGINQANFSFNLIKEKIYKKFRKPKILFESSSANKIDLIEKMNNEKYKIKNSLIAGLNPKKIEKIKFLDKNIIVMRNKQLSKLLYNNSSNSNKNNHIEREIDNDFDENIKKVSKVNESVISSLDKEINNYIKKEKFILDLKK